jgi:hypothetical protein
MLPDVAGYGVYLHTLSLSVAWHRPMTVAVGSEYGSLMILLAAASLRSGSPEALRLQRAHGRSAGTSEGSPF